LFHRAPAGPSYREECGFTSAQGTTYDAFTIQLPAGFAAPAPKLPTGAHGTVTRVPDSRLTIYKMDQQYVNGERILELVARKGPETFTIAVISASGSGNNSLRSFDTRDAVQIARVVLNQK